MNDISLPVLGLTWNGDSSADPRVIWKDGTVVCGGILGAAFDPETKLRHEAAEAHKQELRDQNVVVLEDYRKGDCNGCETDPEVA